MGYRLIYLNIASVRSILVAAGDSGTYSFSLLCGKAFHYMNTPQFFLIHSPVGWHFSSISAIMKNVALKVLVYVSWSPGVKLQGTKSSCNRTVSRPKCFFCRPKCFFWSALPPAALRVSVALYPYYQLKCNFPSYLTLGYNSLFHLSHSFFNIAFCKAVSHIVVFHLIFLVGN